MEVSIRKKHGRQLPVLCLMIIINMLTAFLTPVPADAKDPILVIRIQGEEFETALRGIRQEVEEDLFVSEMMVTRSTTVREMSRKMRDISPKLVVLMDNIAISLYKKYQTASGTAVPSVSLMASFVDIAMKGMKNAAGIFYEVPLVTSIVNLRMILPDVRLRRVGGVFRHVMEPYIKTNRAFCRKERAELSPFWISNRGDMASELKKGLKRLEATESIDALWVLTDSMLINTRLFKEIWMPFGRTFKKPIIVGVEVLAQPRFQFGTFGVVPDHAALGVQAAEMIFDSMEDGWRVNSGTFEQPQSVLKILNLEKAERLSPIKTEQLNFVHKVLK